MADKKTIRRRRLPILLAILIVTISGGITLAWLRPGFVECSGYLEPVGWIPLYTASDGLVIRCELQDGMTVNKGEILVEMDDEWPGWNLERINQELNTIEAEIAFLEQSLELFSHHRDIEEEELRRLRSADLRLLENSSLSRYEYERSEYLYRTFIAGADRDEADFRQQVLLSRFKAASLKLEAELWQERLDECRIAAPESGIYYSIESVQSSSPANLIPNLGPGRRLDSGTLIGYLIPDRGMEARIRIPQQQISRCHPGQNVLLSIDARPLWRFKPVTGRLVSIVSILSGGSFVGTVELMMSEETLKDLKNLSGGDLTASIDINDRTSQRLMARVWDYWSVGVNTFTRR